MTLCQGDIRPDGVVWPCGWKRQAKYHVERVVTRPYGLPDERGIYSMAQIALGTPHAWEYDVCESHVHWPKRLLLQPADHFSPYWSVMVTPLA